MKRTADLLYGCTAAAPDERRPDIEAAAKRWGLTDVPDTLRHSPLIVLTIDGDSAEDRIDS